MAVFRDMAEPAPEAIGYPFSSRAQELIKNELAPALGRKWAF
jgi:hypothetical protein